MELKCVELSFEALGAVDFTPREIAALEDVIEFAGTRSQDF